MKDSPLFFYFIRFCVCVWLKIWLRLESHGSKNIPAEGGVLLASNHVSYLDPPVVACGFRHRVVRFMARDTLFKGRIGGWFMRGVLCVPIDRTRGDVGALRKGIQLLKSGEVMAVFPEGTRSPDGEMKEAKGGMGFLIAKAGVPVVPVYVDGTYRAMPKGSNRIKPGKVRVYYGSPIQPSELPVAEKGRDAYHAIGAFVMDRIARLKPS